MFGRALAAFAAVAAILVVGSSVASAQENPVLDLESAVPVIPYSVAEQLATAGGRLPSVGPGPDHPGVPHNAPFPLNITYVTGSWHNENGSTTLVQCALDVAAEHPYWYQENLIRTLAVGGARCNVRLAEEAGGGITGTVRARGFPSGAQLASATVGSQHQVPEDRGTGWQAYGVATFDRANSNSNQQVQLEARLVLPAWAGKTNIGWNTFGPSCTRGSNNREATCQFSSPPFQNLPYPCPDSPFQGGKLGFQPGACYDQPTACDIENGQYGIQPNCVTLPEPAPADSRGPELLVSGPVRDAADQWVHDGKHDVAVEAVDGSESDPQSGVRRVELLVDGTVINSTERPCPLGNCAIRHTFELDTRALRYGAHDLAVRATDEAGNTTSDGWVVATEPVRTVFELSSPAWLEEVHAAAVTNQVDIMDMGHSDPGPGGYSTGDQLPSEAIAGYRESYREHYGVATDPPVTIVTFGGAIATETLGPMAARVATRDVIDLAEIASEDWPDLAEPSLLYEDDLFNADVAADDQLYDMRDDPDAAVSATAKKFSPAYGKMWTYDNPPIERVVIDQTMRWKEGSLDAFERSGYFDHAYEHDVKLYDNSYNGSRRHPFCKGPSWWATRRVIRWFTDYPDDADPWFDENVADPCQVLDLTIGIKYPLELEERKKYHTHIVTEEGGRDHSPYHLVASKLARNCPGDPRVCAVREPGGDSQLLIGKTRGDAPECRRWRKGRRSRNCDPS